MSCSAARLKKGREVAGHRGASSRGKQKGIRASSFGEGGFGCGRVYAKLAEA
jgi:hypothetical protein